MSEKRDPERRLWRLFLLVHGLIFCVLWIAGLYELVAFPYLINQLFPPLALLWVPFLLLHVAAYAYYSGRKNSTERERQAYRDGVADALRQMRDNSPERTQRLSIDEDVDEWAADEPQKQKRS